ncbi:hypothetical protein HYV81_05630 [Candidatus Woesearchaeota archaeon]|nr:hypothetical protein [Candidatus Woesearchaeota archaeon]
MDIIAKLKSLEHTLEFKDWQAQHHGHYLVHAFKLLDEANKSIWQIGYYDKETDTITTFVIEDGKELKIIPNLEIFKEEKAAIQKLDISKVKVNAQEAVDKAEAFLKEQYPGEVIVKTILILQSIEHGQVYNLSFITKSVSTINIKLAADSGQVLEHHKISLSDLKAQ